MRRNSPQDEKLQNYLASLTKKVTRGNYTDGIPPTLIKTLGRSDKYWSMMTSGSKETYMRMMNFIVDDEVSDHHLGDEHFQNTVITCAADFVSLCDSILNPEFRSAEVFDFPDKLLSSINISTSNFNYGELLKTAAKYMRVRDNKESRIRRYNYICPACKSQYLFGDMQCPSCGKEVNPNGKAKTVPINKDAWHDTFMLLDQWKIGYDRIIALDPIEQDELIRSHIQSNVNSGWPFFEKQSVKSIKYLLQRFCEVVGYKIPKKQWIAKGLWHIQEDRPLVTVNWILDLLVWCHNKKYRFPYVLFYRIQKEKHRSVYGAHVLQKYFAGLMSAIYEFAYEEDRTGSFLDPGFTKRIYGVGGLPIVAQANWDEMFQAILKRFPKYDKTQGYLEMSDDDIRALFGKNVPKGMHRVNIIGGDFSGFDSGQIPEDYQLFRKHKFWGKYLSIILDELEQSDVWTANKALKDIFFKSGFFGTSHFGSGFHRNFTYACAAKKGAIILADINLSDDDLVFVIGMTAKDLQEFASEYGFTMKASQSYDLTTSPIVGFLKVFLGPIFKDNQITMLGDFQSRYYGLAHSERPIELDPKVVDPGKPNVRDVWEVTGDVEIDACISKLASYGSQGGPLVQPILRYIKDTDLGKNVILAISRIDPDEEYKLYREDIEISFPPNWLASLDVTGLLTASSEM